MQGSPGSKPGWLLDKKFSFWKYEKYGFINKPLTLFVKSFILDIW